MNNRVKHRDTHESFGSRKLVQINSERSFGFVFGGVFALIGIWLSNKQGAPVFWPFCVASIFLLLGYKNHRFLIPLNKAWFKFGQFLHALLSPLILGVLFYGTVTPVAVIQRIIGLKTLKVKFDKGKQSYWESRDTDNNDSGKMRRQF